MNQTTPNMTSGQKRDIRKLHNDAVDEFGLTKDQAQKLLSKGGSYKNAIRELVAKLTASDLLEYHSTVTVDLIDRFSVEEVIKTGKAGNAKFWFSDNFKRIFGSLVETNVPSASLRFHRLKSNSVDGPILEELGGAKLIRAFIAHIIALACRQGQGQEGVLLTNGWANIFYVPDPSDPKSFWAVICFWHSSRDGWDFYANPVSYPFKWRAGDQVASSDSSGS